MGTSVKWKLFPSCHNTLEVTHHFRKWLEISGVCMSVSERVSWVREWVDGWASEWVRNWDGIILFDLKLTWLAIVDGCHIHKSSAKLWVCNNSASITRKGCKDWERLKTAAYTSRTCSYTLLVRWFQAGEMTYLVSIKCQEEYVKQITMIRSRDSVAPFLGEWLKSRLRPSNLKAPIAK